MAETAALPLYSNDTTAGPREHSAVRRSLRVLLAEDNKINQQFATLVLNKADTT